MATLWDPIDPDDIVDLWVNFGGSKPFLPPEELITGQIVTPPAEVTIVTSDIDVTGKKVRIRTGPNETGQHSLNYHITTDTGQEFDVNVPLTVKERVKS